MVGSHEPLLHPGAARELLIEIEEHPSGSSETRSGCRLATTRETGRAASNVKRLVRAPSSSQRSVLPCTVRVTTTRRPSGDTRGWRRLLQIWVAEGAPRRARPVEPRQLPGWPPTAGRRPAPSPPPRRAAMTHRQPPRRPASPARRSASPAPRPAAGPRARPPAPTAASRSAKRFGGAARKADTPRRCRPASAGSGRSRRARPGRSVASGCALRVKQEPAAVGQKVRPAVARLLRAERRHGGGIAPAGRYAHQGAPSLGANTMTPSAFHVPPRPSATGASVCGAPPPKSSRFSAPPAKNPMARLSGDQKG